MEDLQKISVSQISGRIIDQIAEMENNGKTSAVRATLANLRNSIGRPMSKSLDVWRIMYEYLPEEFLSKTEKMTPHEKSILNTLQLYAIHRQGNTENVNIGKNEASWKNIGYSLSILRTDDNQVAMDRRFNAMITASSYDEFVHHLRHMLKLLKKYPSAKIDYPRLAEDLYRFLIGNKESVRINWARSYYTSKNKNKGENKDE